MPDGGLATCGSVTFNCRQGRQWYPKIPYLESVKGWTSTFFYCQDMAAPGRQFGIPEFVNAPPMPRPCWDEAVPKLTEELRLIQRRIEFLTRTMAPPLLDGVDTVICWLGRQILPLRYSPHKMCQYSPTDTASLRVSEEILPVADLAFRLRSLVKAGLVKAAEGVPMHTHDYPPLEVNIFFLRPLFDSFAG